VRKRILAWVLSLPHSPARLVTAIGALGLVGILLLITTLEITSQAFFCQSCHYMRGYYDQWKVSSHKKVQCLECHVKPGVTNYLSRKFSAMHELSSMITGKYPSRPHAEVEDASCLRKGCHESRLLKGQVIYRENIVFDHTPHLTLERRGKKLKCATCHAQMVMGTHIAVSEEVCFLCHFKDIVNGVTPMTSKFCQKCHKTLPQSVDIAGTDQKYSHGDYQKPGIHCQDCHINVVGGTGQVPPVMCQACHNKPKDLNAISDPVKMHEKHVTEHKVECYMCHEQIKHSLNAGAHADKRISCSQCHAQGHSAQRDLYTGKGARGIVGAPSSMANAQVACIACHRGDSTDAQQVGYPKPGLRRATVASCVLCHGDDGAGFLQDWKSQVAAALPRAEAVLSQAEKSPILKKDTVAARILSDARYNIGFVKAAHGVHNVDFAVSILEQSSQVLQDQMKKGK